MAHLVLALRFVVALVLYAFLAIYFFVMIRELQVRSRAGASRTEPACIIITAEQLPEQVFSLRPVTAIGRTPDNDVVLRDPYVSANHALIVWREGQWWIEDLRSHNGSYVNGQRVTNPVVLNFGDRIRVGETTLRFEPAPLKQWH